MDLLRAGGVLVVVNLTLSFVLWFSYNWVLLMSAALRTLGASRNAVPLVEDRDVI